MNAGINTSLRASGGGYRQTGVSRYVTELVRALRTTMATGDTLIELGGRLGPASRFAPARALWEQSLLPADVARHRLDVFHGPVNTLPMALRVPSVVTVHDLTFIRNPQHVPAPRRARLIGAIRHSARAAERVVAVSATTADDLVAWLGIDAARIAVIPLAASPPVRRLAGAELHVFRLKYAGGRPHVLAVGTLEPRKNLPMLLRAFAAIKHDVPHRLVLVGPEGWLSGDLRDTVLDLGLGDRLVLTGFVNDEELGGWYSSADLVALPSWHEGFGLPLLEAMSCGVPVLASTAPALAEVGGEAARYADPADQGAWAEAMRDLLRDPTERERMSAGGLARAAAYSWERTAQATWDVYREAAG